MNVETIETCDTLQDIFECVEIGTDKIFFVPCEDDATKVFLTFQILQQKTYKRRMLIGTLSDNEINYSKVFKDESKTETILHFELFFTLSDFLRTVLDYGYIFSVSSAVIEQD